MKTPMQEFIEVLKIQRDMLTEKVDIGNYPEPVIEYYRLRQIVYNDVISLAEAHLEKEKEFMQKVYANAKATGEMDEAVRTFNTKEK